VSKSSWPKQSMPSAGFRNLIEVLATRACEQPGELAYTFLVDGDDETLAMTYGELDSRARAIGARLQQVGAAGGRVLLLFPPGLDFIAAFWGCLYAGAVAVPAYPPKTGHADPRLWAIAGDARPRAALTVSSLLARIQGLAERLPALDRIVWISTDEPPAAGLAAEWRDPEPGGDTLAFLQYTSGSTALPKGVMVSHGNILHNEEMIRRAFGQTRQSVIVGWLPLYHDMGLIGNVLQPLYVGARCVLMSPLAFLQKPLRWLRAISRYRATTSGGPNFAYELCVRRISPSERSALDLASWEVAFSGAEPVRAETLDRFAAAFGPAGFRRQAFYPCYGLAEATLFVAGGERGAGPTVRRFDRAHLERHLVELAGGQALAALPATPPAPPAAPAMPESAAELVSCGRAWLGQQLAIVDPESAEECPAGRVGEIWVSGPSVAPGYWQRPEETAGAFGAFGARSGGGGGEAGGERYLRTGDLGFVAEGELFITGRLKDLIIVRGRNHYPQDLELAAERSHPSVRPGCGAAFAVDADEEERVVLVVELDRRAQAAAAGPSGLIPVIDAIRRAVADAHEVAVHDVVLVRTGTVPKTSSGKVQRHACKADYLAGRLAVVERAAASSEGAGDEAAAVALAREVQLAVVLARELPLALGLSRAALLEREPRDRRAALLTYLGERAARAARLSPGSWAPDTPLAGLDSLAALALRNAVEEDLGVALPLATLLAGPPLAHLADEVLAALAGGDAESLLPASPPAAEFPLSYGQRALWYLDRLAPASAAYNVAAAARLPRGLDSAALRRACQALVDRHPVLRTTFAAPGGEPVQRVRERMEVDFGVLPAASARAVDGEPTRLALGAEDAEGFRAAALAEVLHAEAFRPFDLEAGPLLRLRVLAGEGEEAVVLLAVHHLITDFWSLALLLRELSALYRHAAGGPPPEREELVAPEVTYADYVDWQRHRLAGDEGRRLWDYWRQRLAGELADLDLPADRPRPAVQTHRGGSVALRLGPGLLARLETLGRQSGASLYTILLAAFQALLHRYTGQGDVPVGSPVAGRTRAALAGLPGYLVNAVVLRADLGGDPSFAEHLERTAGDVRAALEHQDFPFPLLAERLRPLRDPGRSPLFQVMFTLQRSPLPGGEALAALALGEPGAPAEMGGLVLEPVPLERRPAQFELALEAAVIAGRLAAVLRYNADLFDAATARRMLGHLAVLLAAAAERPAAAVGELPMLTAAERAQLVEEWNATSRPFPRHLRLHQLCERRARERPESVAVEMEGENLSFGELDRRANQLACRLRRMGIERERLVALHLERSPEMVVALLGVLKTGGAYLPLDPSYPEERLRFMLEDSGARVLLTQRRLRPPGSFAGAVLCLDADWPEVAGESAELPPEEPAAPAAPTASGGLAYLIYTSGSTGTPKGVLVRHDAVVNFLTSMRREPGLAAADVLLSVTTLSFDIAALEIFLPLLAGARLVLATRAAASDGAALAAELERCQATVMQATPATWRLLLAASWRGRAGLAILCGGEALPRELAAELLTRGAALWNLYGPTETTIWSAAGRVAAAEGPVPLGPPIANTSLHLLDRRLQLVPVGVAGEVWIGGAGLARGYHGQPALTAERFVPDALGESGGRLYRTGDVARRRADGRIDFLGRADHQVKLRGHRVELGEIEACLARHPALRGAVVLAREEQPGDLRLVAYVVAEGQAPASTELRSYLRARLPEPLVPGSFVFLDAWPLTPNGKIDRRALPAPRRAGAAAPEAAGYLPPRPGLERAIAAIWQEVLGVPRVGVRDNFFDLGGHSLLLARVQARLKEELPEAELTMVDLLRHSTVGALAAFLGGAGALPARRVRRRPEAPGERGEIAVLAMSGRFPGAADVESFWRNLRGGMESIVPLTDDELRAARVAGDLLADPAYVKAAAALDGVESFDAAFFGYSPREAETLDPQHRLFLECAWEALELAGYDAERVAGAVGVYAGVGINGYLLNNLYANRDFLAAVGSYQAFIANDKDFVPTRVSYKLNLRGPSVNVQTACSSSLVAVHLACQSLRLGECDMALAGGVSIAVPHRTGYLYQEGGILSPDGHCRAFDARARGTVRGSGAGVVVLKRLAEALACGDPVRAVIRGSAINNDGSGKAGFTAPSVDGQAEVIAAALAAAEVGPGEVGYVEAHGTGTELGDPVEVAALTQAFRAAGAMGRGFCALGSVKTNVGHLDTAAGVAGLIKAVLAIERGELPPSLHFAQPNPNIDFASSPFRVNSALTAWPGEAGAPRRAGVSSFGIGGTNAHVVIAEAPAAEPSGESRPAQLLLLSARSPAALEAETENLAALLAARPDLAPAELADIAFTLQVGRRAFAHRRMAVCRGGEDALAVLADRDRERLSDAVHEPGERPVVFLFPGQGAQHAGMAADLYRGEALFRARVDEGAERLQPLLGLDLRELLYPRDGNADGAARLLRRTAVAQPALFVVEHALAELWMSWGVRPQAMLGHSIGELVAACLAGVCSFADALGLAAERGRLMDELPAGAMLAVALSERDLLPLIGPGLSLAAVNGPSACTVAGPAEAVAELERRLAERAAAVRRLHVSHAFHSAMMEPAVAPYVERLRGLERRPPRIPFLSNASGTWITAAEATDPAYWGRHLRATVRFAAGVAELLREQSRVLLEVGPGQTLATLARQHPRRPLAISSLRHPRDPRPDLDVLLAALGRLWMAGVPIDWDGFYAGERRRRCALPTYPFERQRHWVEPAEPRSAAPRPRRTGVDGWFYAPLWKETVPPGLPASPPPGSAGRDLWLVFADSSGLGGQLAGLLSRRGHDVVTVARSTLDPRDPAGYDSLLAGLDRPACHIVHAWAVDPLSAPEDGELLFDGLLLLGQALGRRSWTGRLRLTVLSSGLHAVSEKALVLGPCRVIPQEYPLIACRSLDVMLPEEASRLDELAELVAAELEAASADPVVAYRGEERWVQTYEPVDLAAPAPRPGPGPRLRERGVYLITGGLGGLGLTFAELLARQARARLVLVGRRPFPPRAEWEERLTHFGDEPAGPAGQGPGGVQSIEQGSGALQSVRQARVISRLLALEALGAEVLVARGDVTDESAMSAVVSTARERFGAVHGVVHAAGVSGGGMIQLKGLDASSRVLAPKVRGTRVLERVLAGEALDFFLLCSSITAVLGGFGQVDYCAANAYLDVFARSRASRRGTFYAAIDWDRWRDVGMAARPEAAQEGWSAAADAADAADTGRDAGAAALHPLLDRCLAVGPERAVYATRLDVAGRWVLGEHRIMGRATVPGAAYLEMARAAFEQVAGAGPVEIREAVFLLPLSLHDGERIGVLTVLEREGEGFRFRVVSEPSGAERGEPGVREHARGSIGRLSQAAAAAAASRRVDIGEIRERCAADLGSAGEAHARRLAGFLDTGARWRSLRAMTAGAGESLGTLELPPAFAGELAAYALHPALLDVAAGSVQLRAPSAGRRPGAPDPSAGQGPSAPDKTAGQGPGAPDQTAGQGPGAPDQAAGQGPGAPPEQANYLPLAYESLRLYTPLPARFYSHARYRESPPDGDTLTCDLSLVDAAGNLLVEISGFSMKRVGEAAARQLEGLQEPSGPSAVGASGSDAAGAAEPPGTAPAHPISARGGQPATETAGAYASRFAALIEGNAGAARGGISPREGAEVLCRVLAGRLHQVVVSTVELGAAMERAASLDSDSIGLELAALSAPPAIHARPQVKSFYIAPGNDFEQRIAAIWQRVLGIEKIGVHDNFFELGGTSLSGVQLIAELKKALAMEIPAVSIFEAPTIAALARHLSPKDSGPAFERTQERARRKLEALERRRELQQDRRRGPSVPLG
jgi:amino acid adenylation domain-containing protein